MFQNNGVAARSINISRVVFAFAKGSQYYSLHGYNLWLQVGIVSIKKAARTNSLPFDIDIFHEKFI